MYVCVKRLFCKSMIYISNVKSASYLKFEYELKSKPFDISTSIERDREREREDGNKMMMNNDENKMSVDVNDKKPSATTTTTNKRPQQPTVAYVYSPSLIEQLDKIPRIAGRAQLVNSLIHSYGLFDKLKLVAAQPCDAKQLQTFHSSSYVDYLQRRRRRRRETTNNNNNNDDDEDDEDDDDDDEFTDENDDSSADDNDRSTASYYGLDHDCPMIDDVFQFCAHVGGASLTAADLLVAGADANAASVSAAGDHQLKSVVNWFGGWHHAKRERASGYCYVNDCVLAILRLRRRFERVLYVDLDLHHGDGVQEAFEYTNKVVTLSFHKHSPGFFPGTGSLGETGKGPAGKYHTVNVPLLSGLDDSTLVGLFSPIFTKLVDVYRPEAIVVQCGADGLYGDPIDTGAEASFNLTLDGYLACVRTIMRTRLPTLYLGGGGYHLANTARLWTSIVALLVSEQNNADVEHRHDEDDADADDNEDEFTFERFLKADIPDHDAFFLHYAPSYEMRVEPGCHRNKNTPEYVQKVLDTVLSNLDMIKI